MGLLYSPPRLDLTSGQYRSNLGPPRAPAPLNKPDGPSRAKIPIVREWEERKDPVIWVAQPQNFHFPLSQNQVNAILMKPMVRISDLRIRGGGGGSGGEGSTW